MNDPLPAAVALTVLNVVLRNKLPEKTRVLYRRLHAVLHSLQQKYGCIGDVRDRNLLAGIEIVENRVTKESAPAIGEALAASMRALSLSTNFTAHSKGLAPPLTITDEELDLGLKMMENAFDSVEKNQPCHLLNLQRKLLEKGKFLIANIVNSS